MSGQHRLLVAADGAVDRLEKMPRLAARLSHRHQSVMILQPRFSKRPGETRPGRAGHVVVLADQDDAGFSMPRVIIGEGADRLLDLAGIRNRRLSFDPVRVLVSEERLEFGIVEHAAILSEVLSCCLGAPV